MTKNFQKVFAPNQSSIFHEHLSQTKAMLMEVCELLVAAMEELTDRFVHHSNDL